MSVVLERPRLTVPVSERDHVLGPATAPVTVVEHGDYEYPFCGAAHRSLKQVLGVMGNDMRFAFRHVTDLRGHAYAGRLREDFLSGVRSGVNGTPTFFVNGIRHDGGSDAEALLDALRREL
jgi:protein-disulfide isomerase